MSKFITLTEVADDGRRERLLLAVDRIASVEVIIAEDFPPLVAGAKSRIFWESGDAECFTDIEESVDDVAQNV